MGAVRPEARAGRPKRNGSPIVETERAGRLRPRAGIADPAAARRLGADAVADVHEAPQQLVTDLTDGLGADVVIEAVGGAGSFVL